MKFVDDDDDDMTRFYPVRVVRNPRRYWLVGTKSSGMTHVL